MSNTDNYMKKRRRLNSLFFASALPNEYLVAIGGKEVKPILGGRKFRIGKKFLRVPASVQRLHFVTDNANIDYQGIGIEGFAVWRINPVNPSKAISTLDFFDDNDPMARTNEDMKTICVEAVRHVIANMSIDDALRKKDEIAENLKTQLIVVEEKWGIVFDQVGIVKVTIMSNRLFQDLQSDFRSQHRLKAERVRISTDRELAKEANLIMEKNELEKLDVERKLQMQKMQNDAQLNERRLVEKQKFEEQERIISEENYRKEQTFRMEQEDKENELITLKNNLELERHKIEANLLNSQLKIQETKDKIAERAIEIKKQERQAEQVYSEGEISAKFIEVLPEVFGNLNIQNYSVIEGGKDSAISPAGRLLHELIAVLKNSGKEL